MEARQKWQKKQSRPLQTMRDYRNHLVHGRLTPGIIGVSFYLPKIGLESQYFDWRKVTNNPKVHSLVGVELVAPPQILADAWKQTLGYLNSTWAKYLI